MRTQRSHSYGAGEIREPLSLQTVLEISTDCRESPLGWYPGMQTTRPDTWNFVVSMPNNATELWNVHTKQKVLT